MKNNLLQEIKKIKFQSTYNPGKTLNQNLLTEQRDIISLFVKGLVKREIKLAQRGLNTLAQRLQFFRTQFGDDVYDILVRLRKGSPDADELIERYMRGGTLENVDIAHLVTAMSKGADGAQFKKLWAESMENQPLKKMLDNVPPKNLLKFKDNSTYWKYFDDELLDELFGTNLVALRKAAGETVEKTTKKTTKLSKEKNFFRKWLERRGRWWKGGEKFDFSKSGLRKSAIWSMDSLALTLGISTIFSIFSGPLVGFLTTITLQGLGKLLMRFKPLKNVSDILQGQAKKVKQATKDIGGDGGEKLLKDAEEMATGWNQYLFSTTKKGAKSQWTITTKLFWRLTASLGVLMQLVLGYMANIWKVLGVGPEVSATADFLRAHQYNGTQVIATLNGNLYTAIGGEEGVRELGVEFEDTVIDKSAEMLIDILDFGNDFSRLVEEVPVVGDIIEDSFITKYWTWSSDIEKSQDIVLEWVENTPSLLFISAVSERIKEKTGGKSLYTLIKEYTVSMDMYVMDIVKDVFGGTTPKYRVDVNEIAKLLQGKPLLDEDLDQLVVDLYDSVMSGRLLGEAKTLIENLQLDCGTKEELFNQGITPAFEDVNKVLRAGGLRTIPQPEFDCGADEISGEIPDLQDAKKIQRITTGAPLEGVLYLNDDGFITTKNTRGANELYIELIEDLTLEELFGTELSITDEGLTDSDPRGIMYYNLVDKPSGEEYCEYLSRAGYPDSVFAGGKGCTRKHIKQMPILKTIAAAEMAGLDKDWIFDTQNTLIDVFNQVTKGEVTPEFMDIEENKKIVGLGRILMRSRKK